MTLPRIEVFIVVRRVQQWQALAINSAELASNLTSLGGRGFSRRLSFVFPCKSQDYVW